MSAAGGGAIGVCARTGAADKKPARVAATRTTVRNARGADIKALPDGEALVRAFAIEDGR